MLDYLHERRWVLLGLCLLPPTGFALWYYKGPLEYWINLYVTCSIYVIFWSLAFFFFKPYKKNAAKITIYVFIATCIIEISQLWRPVFLKEFRRTLFGMAIIGTDFVWLQFPFYIAGAIIAWLWLRSIGTDNNE